MASSVRESGAKSQIHFTGESRCTRFVANAFRPSMCSECSRLISHHKAAVVDDAVVEKALEHLVESVPSEVLPKDGKWGALYLGGYKAAININFLKEHRANVLTAAGGLEKFFGPKYEKAISSAKKEGVDYMTLDWVDATYQVVEAEDLRRAVVFIEESRSNGHAVLVHCAQGKSRSATVCVAYLMAKQSMTSSAALAFVQQKRQMAEPNPAFQAALKEFESSNELQKLRQELSQME